MRTQPYYDRKKLKSYVCLTGLNREQMAARLGVRRVQVSRALNERGASLSLVQRIVAVCNAVLSEEARQQEIPFQPLDWRTLLSNDSSHPEKILENSVS